MTMNTLYLQLDNISFDIDICDYISEEELTGIITENNDAESAKDAITETLNNKNAFSGEVLYYSVAIEYLSENDPSLNESLKLAKDLGFGLDSINSEVLASLLRSNNLQIDYYETVEPQILEMLEEYYERNDQ